MSTILKGLEYLKFNEIEQNPYTINHKGHSILISTRTFDCRDIQYKELFEYLENKLPKSDMFTKLIICIFVCVDGNFLYYNEHPIRNSYMLIRFKNNNMRVKFGKELTEEIEDDIISYLFQKVMETV